MSPFRREIGMVQTTSFHRENRSPRDVHRTTEILKALRIDIIDKVFN